MSTTPTAGALRESASRSLWGRGPRRISVLATGRPGGRHDAARSPRFLVSLAGDSRPAHGRERTMHDMTHRRRPGDAVRSRRNGTRGGGLQRRRGPAGTRREDPVSPWSSRWPRSTATSSSSPRSSYFVDAVGGAVGRQACRSRSPTRSATSSRTPSSRSCDGVADGRYDLGVVGTQVFDTLGVSSFQALNAPMLVDSYALQAAVLESGLTDTMMQPLERHRSDRRRHAGGRPAQAGGRGGGTRWPRRLARSHLRHLSSPKPSSRRSALSGRAGGRVRGRPRPGAARPAPSDGFESSVLAYRLNGQ